MNDPEKPAERHALVHVRHELRKRQVTVSRIEDLSPRMRRIQFSSPELEGFSSIAHDDHVKVFFAPSESGEPVMRDFTPRAFDAAASVLTLDFALHDKGPAAEWAKRAAIGDTLEVGGPRGSVVVPDDFDWYLMFGDESALPAMGRRVEELRSGVPVTTVAVIADAGERQQWKTDASWDPRWIERGAPSVDDGARLVAALDGLTPPPGDGFVWIAGEAEMVRAVHVRFIEARHPRGWLKSASYWHRARNDTEGHT